MRLNVTSGLYESTTHEGGKARAISSLQALRRSVLSCMLWENEFYESGKTIAKRIEELVGQVKPEDAAALALEAREQMYLRHVPLLIVTAMARKKDYRPYVRKTLARVIQRADELAEFLAIYWQDGKGDRKKSTHKLAKSVQKGLGDAFKKFSQYQLAKYNRDNPIKLRDVLFLSHSKPATERQEEIYKQLVDNTLPVPDTWEVELSKGKGENQKESWERLLNENKLGALALLRNLRNMTQANVSDSAIRSALRNTQPDKVLPFRFIAAAKHAPQFTAELEEAMMKNLHQQGKLLGMTAVLVDVSGSMTHAISSKSDLRRLDAACGVAIFAREVCESCRIFTFSDSLVEVPNYKGLALTTAIPNSQRNANTYLGKAVTELNTRVNYNRIIVITDEQSHDVVPGPKALGYMINVASAKNGVGYGAWRHIDGWSERVLDYIRVVETEETAEEE